MARPRTVYRGETSYGWIVTLVVSILVALLLLGIWLFYDLQQYIVYDKDGLRLVLPAERAAMAALSGVTDEEDGVIGPVDAEIVVDEADFTAVEGTEGSGLSALRARFIAAENVTQATLDNYISGALAAEALVLELKPASGLLSYSSVLALTRSYEVNGSFDIRESVAQLKEKDIYLVAQLSCLVDGTMAVRNSPTAMKNAASGSVYTGDGRAWLDPYNDAVRGYIGGLIAELAGMGFDEILLTGLWLPEDGALRYSGEMTAVPDSVSAVSSLALWLRDQADALGVRLSAYAVTPQLRQGTSESIGQDITVFFKAFDRVAFEDTADGYAASLGVLSAVAGANADTRVLPVVSGYTTEHESYVVK